MRELSRGEVADVYLARHEQLGTPCVVKLLNAAGMTPERRGRFAHEARAAARIRSAHVVQILDCGTSAGQPYIAMEHLRGEDLRGRLDRKHCLPAHVVESIVRQIARALTKAHAANVIHRDLKPSNVFLAIEGEREVVKVLDFGLAKSVGWNSVQSFETQRGALVGTSHYMSPEQASSKEVDHRADLWALAVLAYECLVGAKPFDGPSAADVMIQVLSGAIPVPSQHANVPVTFDAWWRRAAAQYPAERFQSAREMADALGVALGCTRVFRGPSSEVPSRPASRALPSLPPMVSPAAKTTASAIGLTVASEGVLGMTPACVVGTTDSTPAQGHTGQDMALAGLTTKCPGYWAWAAFMVVGGLLAFGALRGPELLRGLRSDANHRTPAAQAAGPESTTGPGATVVTPIGEPSASDIAPAPPEAPAASVRPASNLRTHHTDARPPKPSTVATTAEPSRDFGF